MIKRIAAIMRFLTTPPAWFNRRTAAVLAVSAAFVGIMIWLIPPDRPHTLAAARSQAAAAITPLAATAPPAQPTPSSALPTRTPLPPEYFTTTNETSVIAFFGVALLLIVFIGTAIFMPRGPDS